MFKRLLATMLVLSVPILAAAQAKPGALDGVWRVAEVTTTGANAATNTSPQPSLVIFANGYYSYLSVNGTQARPTVPPPKDPANWTDAEKLARYEQWNPFTAQSGTYEAKGTTLTRKAIVAKNVNVMTAAAPNVQEFKLEGNSTLWLITKSAAGQPVSETRTKLVRVK